MGKQIVTIGLVMLTLLGGCASIPKNARPIDHFEPDRYMGKWYEIARLDHKQERDLNNVTAQYSFNADGTIKVLNSGFNYVKSEWESATGKAAFRGDTNIGALKVSFFGPFYSGYNVIALDEEYRYALVAGESLKYLWILSRETTIPDSIKREYLEKAEEIGYDTSKLIWVEHGKKQPDH